MDTNVNQALIEKMLQAEAFKNFVGQYNVGIGIIMAIITIAVIMLLFINVVKLSSSSTNEGKRSEALNGVLICFICLAFCGSIDVIYVILLSIIFA